MRPTCRLLRRPPLTCTRPCAWPCSCAFICPSESSCPDSAPACPSCCIIERCASTAASFSVRRLATSEPSRAISACSAASCCGLPGPPLLADAERQPLPSAPPLAMCGRKPAPPSLPSAAPCQGLEAMSVPSGPGTTTPADVQACLSSEFSCRSPATSACSAAIWWSFGSPCRTEGRFTMFLAREAYHSVETDSSE